MTEAIGGIPPSSGHIGAYDFDLAFLTDNVPGGMFSCLSDPPLTLVQMNRGFLSMLGFTRAEISQRFQDSFWALIDPRDREPTLAEVHRQMALGPDKEIEYRLKRKDGSTIWVLDKGRLIHPDEGPDYYCCILVDITRAKELESRLRLSLERHQIIMDQANDVIFEWDLTADKIEFSSNWEKKFGCRPVTEHINSTLTAAPHVHPEDRSRFASLMKRIIQGEHFVEGEVRFCNATGAYLWCRVRITGQQEDSGVTCRAVGVIADIDAEKRQTQRLLDSARRDALTKLYNRGSVQELISGILGGASGTPCCALLIIDLDNFKRINDTMGHLAGDALLTEIAKTLQQQFRSEDVVGRIGGDEFIAFLGSIPGPDTARAKAEQTIRALRSIPLKELGAGAVTCSIGVACSPECGSTYHELFQRADQALYQAKRMGKDRCFLFDAGRISDMVPGSGVQGASAVGASIDSDAGIRSVTGQLVEYIFHILYTTVDMEAAVQAILEIVGRQFDVSRAYIFENTPDDGFCCNTFEWCNTGVGPEIQNLQKVSYAEDLDGVYEENFNEEGVFYCRDIRELNPSHYAILAPQGIKSILQCAIYDRGRFRGYVGFDECRSSRYWTQEQISTLSFISRILSIFLLKQRAQRNAEHSARAMEAILDSQSAWIYIIRPETFELLYINRKTRELAPGAFIGGRCHTCFFGNCAPCAFCPASELSVGRGSSSLEIYNPLLKVWTSTDACYIDWNGERCILLTCHDITKFKPLPPDGAGQAQ